MALLMTFVMNATINIAVGLTIRSWQKQRAGWCLSIVMDLGPPTGKLWMEEGTRSLPPHDQQCMSGAGTDGRAYPEDEKTSKHRLQEIQKKLELTRVNFWRKKRIEEWLELPRGPFNEDSLLREGGAPCFHNVFFCVKSSRASVPILRGRF